MKVNPEIFRAYDIRGLYPQDLNEEVAFLVGQAFVDFLEKIEAKRSGKLKIVIGRDNRLSSPILHKNLIKGILDRGADIIDLGTVTTPIFYFAVAHYHYDGGIMITASHNPRQYNGFKIVRKGSVPVSEASGLKEILKIIQAGFHKSKRRGKLVRAGNRVVKDYLKFNLKGFNKDNFKSFKIVIDTANAVSGMAVTETFKNLPCKIIHLFKKADGRFPNHEPNPLIEDNLKQLKLEVLRQKADFGVAFDGDGDRIFFVDENGRTINSSVITAFLAVPILRDHPGEKIIYDVRSSRIVEETIKKNGGWPIVYCVGHSFIKEKMRKDNVLFGAEFAGHYYHRDHYFCEAPFFVLFTVLKELGKKPFSQMIAPYQKYYHSGEINLKISDKKTALSRLKKQYVSGHLIEIDGLKVDYPDWWFLARASNTEPVLRLIIEAKTKELLDKKKAELLAIIKN